MNVSGKNGWDYELLILSVNHGKQQTLFLPYVQVFFSWSTWFKYSYTVATRNTLSRVLVQNKSEQCSKYSSSTFRCWHQFSQTSNSFNPDRICPEILNSNWFPWVIRVATICFRTSNFQQIQKRDSKQQNKYGMNVHENILGVTLFQVTFFYSPIKSWCKHFIFLKTQQFGSKLITWPVAINTAVTMFAAWALNPPMAPAMAEPTKFLLTLSSVSAVTVVFRTWQQERGCN